MTNGQKENLKKLAWVLLAAGVVALIVPQSRAWLIEKWNACKDAVTGWFSKKA